MQVVQSGVPCPLKYDLRLLKMSIVCAPTAKAAVANAAMSMCRPGEQEQKGVIPVKMMSRFPRGTTVKEHHSLVSLKGVQFAEQLQVLPLVNVLHAFELHDTWLMYIFLLDYKQTSLQQIILLKLMSYLHAHLLLHFIDYHL